MSTGLVPIASADIGPGQVKTHSSGAFVPLKDRFLNAVDVADFGAVGDGVADDTVAINLALATRKSVVLTKAVYKASATLVFGEGCGLVSNTGSRVVTSAADVISLEGSNIKIRGIYFESTLGYGKFKQQFKNTTSNILIEHCFFEGCQIGRAQGGAGGDYNGGIGDDSLISHCTVFGGSEPGNPDGYPGIAISHVTNVEVSQCKVYDWTGEAIKVAASSSKYVRIDRNYCHDCTRDGVDLYNGGHFSSVTNNVFVSCQKGIEIKYGTPAFAENTTDSDKCIVSGNIVKGSNIAIYAAANNVLIEGNYCEGEIAGGGWGTVITGNNVLAKDSTRGISGKGLINGVISNNTIRMTNGDADNRPLYLAHGTDDTLGTDSIRSYNVVIAGNVVDCGGFSPPLYFQIDSANSEKIKVGPNYFHNFPSGGSYGGYQYFTQGQVVPDMLDSFQQQWTNYHTRTGTTADTSSLEIPIKAMNVGESIKIIQYVEYTGAGSKYEQFWVETNLVNVQKVTLFNAVATGVHRIEWIVSITGATTLNVCGTIQGPTNNAVVSVDVTIADLMSTQTRFRLRGKNSVSGDSATFKKVIYGGVPSGLKFKSSYN